MKLLKSSIFIAITGLILFSAYYAFNKLKDGADFFNAFLDQLGEGLSTVILLLNPITYYKLLSYLLQSFWIIVVKARAGFKTWLVDYQSFYYINVVNRNLFKELFTRKVTTRTEVR
jgi:hypothetical protein